MMHKIFCKSYHMLFSFVRISCNQRSCGLLRRVPFIEITLGAVVLITVACDRSLLQSASGTKKCDRLLL